MRQKLYTWPSLRISLTGFFLFVYLCVPAFFAYANTDFSVTPLIIDRSTEGRDIITETITIHNRTDRLLRLYASVHDISLNGAGEIQSFITPSMTDRTKTLSSWVEISRARLEVLPESSLEVPITIRVSPKAEPGQYHGFIGFATGHNRDIAEATIMRGGSQGIILRTSIDRKINEQLQLVGYTTDRFAALGGEQSVRFTLKNIGDVPLAPQGEIIIYDNRGREQNAVNVELSSVTIEPGGEYEFVADLPKVPGFGRYKAFLTLDYGARRATVHDTTFFVSVPWLMILLLILAIFSVLFAIMLLLKVRPVAVHAPQVSEVGFLVRPRRAHKNYDHDINLKVKS